MTEHVNFVHTPEEKAELRRLAASLADNSEFPTDVRIQIVLTLRAAVCDIMLLAGHGMRAVDVSVAVIALFQDESDYTPSDKSVQMLETYLREQGVNVTLNEGSKTSSNIVVKPPTIAKNN